MGELRRNIQINGEIFHLAVNQYGSGEPAGTTPGKPGVLYMDSETGELYKCRTADAEKNRYVWEKINWSGTVSWNDVTDKPFIPKKVYHVWDEDIEYEVTVPSLEGMTFSQFARISDDAPPSDFFVGKSVEIWGTDNSEYFHKVVLLRASAILQYSADVYVVSGGALSYYVCTGDSADLEGIHFTKGIWCMDGWKEPLFDYVLTRLELIDPAVTIDESVIPFSIARLDDLPAPVTDEHINFLIDEKLGAIENGTY